MTLHDITNGITVHGNSLEELKRKRILERLCPTPKPIPIQEIRRRIGSCKPMVNVVTNQETKSMFELAVLLNVNYGWLTTQIRVKGYYQNWIELL